LRQEPNNYYAVIQVKYK